VVLSLGSPLLVTVSLGPMAADIGTACLAVWTLTAVVGLVQCLLIAELAGRFRRRWAERPPTITRVCSTRLPLFIVVAARCGARGPRAYRGLRLSPRGVGCRPTS
jgi:hypothetical protein